MSPAPWPPTPFVDSSHPWPPFPFADLPGSPWPLFGVSPPPLPPPGPPPPSGGDLCGETTVVYNREFDNAVLNALAACAGSNTELLALMVVIVSHESGGDPTARYCRLVEIPGAPATICADLAEVTLGSGNLTFGGQDYYWGPGGGQTPLPGGYVPEDSVGLFQLNRNGGVGTGYNVSVLTGIGTNVGIACARLKAEFDIATAAGYTGVERAQRAAAGGGWQADVGAIGTEWSAVLAELQALTFPLPCGISLSAPSGGSITADCPWHVENEGFPAVDFACSEGSPVVASHAGTVVFAGLDPRSDPAQDGSSTLGYGNMVRLRHVSGWETLYGHFSSLSVSINDVVAVGQELGKCGSTGYSFGPHVHLELRDADGERVCPCLYMGLNEDCEDV